MSDDCSKSNKNTFEENDVQVEDGGEDEDEDREKNDIDDGEEQEEEDGTSDFDNYYKLNEFEDDLDFIQDLGKNNDPEYFEYECLQIEEVERLLNESVEDICKCLHVTPSLAKVLLFNFKWDSNKLKAKYQINQCSNSNFTVNDTLFRCKENTFLHQSISTSIEGLFMCNICLNSFKIENCLSLNCGHLFCKQCWSSHLEVQISCGATVSIECMAQACHELVPEDFALDLVSNPCLRKKYQQFAFTDYVKSHPNMCFCPGPDCKIIIYSKENKSKKVVCKQCKATFCYKCGQDYHAPTTCNIIKKWLTKCADDSETANYISAHTKDCPKCHSCIEKNGGCNHMRCYTCKHDFCWMCLGDWKNHGSEYYECSRYKENPKVICESILAQAREALKKYLFYYERWENHARSLRLEEQALEKIKERIQKKVMSNKGTWIDWQYLVDAAALLAKCRYTLQYTYPYAYYMENGPRKELFEYQQAQLEAEIENLSWKVERAETTDRGELENQMDIAEKRRATLLKDFLAN